MKFKEFKLSHVSNGSDVQDGLDVYAIREGGTQVWAATSGENLSRLQVEVVLPEPTPEPDPIEPTPEPDPIEPTPEPTTGGPTVKPQADDLIYTVGSTADFLYTYEELNYLKLVAYINYVNEHSVQGEELITHLWDALKKELRNEP